MKKKLALLLALMMAVVLLFAACEGDKPTEEHVHDYGTLIAEVPATCTTAGTKAHYHCSGCNKDFDSEKNEITDLAIPTVAHTEVVDAAVAATCTTDGKTEGKHCSVCGTVTVAQTTVPATGHTESGNWIVDKAATCEEAGSRHKVCSVCGETAVTETIPATGHTEGEWIIDTEATCTEAGSKHQVCSVCGKTIATEVIPASHTFGEWVEGTAATCDEAGTKGYFYCSVCEKYFDESGEEITDFVIPAIGHTPVLVEEVAPTCGDSGVKAHYHCEACGKDFDEAGNELTAEDLAIPATGHTWTELYVPKVNAASCAEPGMKAHYYCPDCGKYFDAMKKTETTKENLLIYINHTFGSLIAEVPATCDTDGTVEHYHCSVCEKDFDKNKNEISDPIIPALGHTYQQTGGLTKKGTSYVIPCHCPTCGKDVDAEYKLTASFRRFLYDGDVCTGISPADESTLEAHYYCAEFDKYLNLNLEEITAADLKPSNAIGIYNDADMAAFAKMVTDGNAFAGESFALLADVSLNTTIGATSSKPFSGNFDGMGHTVTIKQTLSNPDGIGGLFSFVRVPENGVVTIQNLHLTGRIDATNSNTGSGYFGGLVSTVDGNTSGNGSTININNVWNSVYINCGLNNMWTSVGGMIGFTRHADGLKPLTVNFDSCVWDGTLNVGPAAYHFGGFVGYTGNNKAGRTLTINIENSVASGVIAINQTWDQTAGLLIGYAKGSYNDDATAKVTVNINNVISNGKMTFKTGAPGSGSNIGHIGKADGSTEVNMTNLYYNAFERGALEGNAPALGNGSANTSTNAEAKTAAEIYFLTTAAFTDASKWNVGTGHNPCPAAIATIFGAIPESLETDETEFVNEFEIATAEELVAFADKVNSGSTYSGKTVKLTADIDLTDSSWRSIGTRNDGNGAFAFRGTFDGQGHTVTLNSTTAAQSEGGLFGYLGDGAIVKNVKVTGKIELSTDLQVGYYGSVVGCATGTVQISNVWSNVNILTKAKWFKYSGGFIGGLENLKSANLTITDCVYSGTIFSNASVQESGGFFGYSGRLNNTDTKTVTFVRCVFSGSFEVNTTQGYYEDTGLFMGYMQNNGNNTGKLTVSMTDCIVAGTFKFGERASEINKNGACVIGWAGFSNAATSHTLNNVYYVPNNYPNESAVPAYNVTSGHSVSGQGATAKTLDEIKALTADNFTNGGAWTFVEGNTPVPSTIYNSFMAE